MPESLERSPNDIVYVSNGKIYNSVLNINNLEEKTETLSDVVASSITFEGENTSDVEIDITELVNDLCVDQFGLNLTSDTLPIILIIYNEFYDGNLLVEQFLNKNQTYTLITNEGKIFSSSAMNFNITI